MQERDFKGVWIPKEIWLNSSLSMIEKGILTEIASLDGENHCYASNEYFADFCQVSIPTVTRAIQKLISLNYIEVVSFDGRKRVIKLMKQTNQFDEADTSKRLTSNIDINTEKKEVSNTKVLDMEKSKPLNFYQKCAKSINEYTDDEEVKEVLFSFLNILVKNGTLHSNSKNWDKQLEKLSSYDATKKQIVAMIQICIDKGYSGFFNPTTVDVKSKNKSWTENVETSETTEEDREKFKQNLLQMAAEGKQTVF